jgi:LSD1 subclass zinc finger protein
MLAVCFQDIAQAFLANAFCPLCDLGAWKQPLSFRRGARSIRLEICCQTVTASATLSVLV